MIRASNIICSVALITSKNSIFLGISNMGRNEYVSGSKATYTIFPNVDEKRRASIRLKR